MSKVQLYFFCFLLFSSCTLFGQDYKPTLNTIDSVFSYGNSVKAKELLHNKIIQLEKSKTRNPLLLSRHYNLLGEIYFSESDIGPANDYWKKSFALINKTYGKNSVFMAENYCKLARYYNYRIMNDSAYYYIKKAITICHQKKDSMRFIPAHKIYREYAFTLKIKGEQFDYLNARVESRLLLDSSNHYNKLYFKDELFNAQILQDIGNTFTDATIYHTRLSKLKSPSLAEISFKKANSYYDKTLEIYTNAFSNKHLKISTLFYVKGLTYEYCYGQDSLVPALTYFQKGICALSPKYNNTKAFDAPDAQYHYINQAQAIVLTTQKIGALHKLYLKTKDIVYLEYCYNHSLFAVKLWETTFANLKTNEIQQALEVYGSSPFRATITCGTLYYSLTGKTAVKENVFKWMDLNKYSTLLKVGLENNTISLHSKSVTIPEIQSKLTQTEAIVEYFVYDQQLTCVVISKNKFDLFPLNNTFAIDKSIDSLLSALKKHDSKKYCKFAKVLYDTILNPYIKNLPKEINHLIIIPHANLAQIPFDALVLNPAGNYSQADFLIKHFNISYAMSCNLLFSAQENTNLNNRISIISPDYKQHSKLPFSKKLIDRLKNGFETTEFALNDTTRNSSILQVTAHAFCDYKDSRSSYILLSDSQKLSLGKISNSDLKYKLAVLNACETASGNIEKGEGVINFSRHFYLAGVKSTITTLWKVDDEATADIVGTFYTELQNNGAIKSLYTAKLKFLNSARSVDDFDPYYWAGLVYTGSDLKLEESRSNKVFVGFAGFGLLVLLGLIPLIRKLFF